LKINRTVAAILANSRQDLYVDEIELPRDLKSGQVLVQLISSGICGAQLNEIDAIKGEDQFLPHLLGHEGLCRVLEVASDVSRVRVDDIAIMHWRKGTGINSETPLYKWRGKKLNAGWVTTFNEHSVVSENRLTRIPSQLRVSSDVLPLLGCALTTAFGVATKEIPSNKSGIVLLFGAGGVGLALVAVLHMLKKYEIVVIDKDFNKLEIAKSLGAHQTILFESKDQCGATIKKYLKSSGADIALETSGNTSCIELAYELTKENGFVNLIGVPALQRKVFIHTLPLHYGKILRGSDGGSTKPDTDIPILIGLLESKLLLLDHYPLEFYGLKDINFAIQNLRKGQPGRSIIRF
jgi:S-(hydroxymethyl)glutathione dehydrogenase/alcohol dehydrogenase